MKPLIIIMTINIVVIISLLIGICIVEDQYEQCQKERDILSDIIRNVYDNDTNKQEILQISNTYLEEINSNFDSLDKWSYCY